MLHCKNWTMTTFSIAPIWGNKVETNANIPGICPVSKNSWNTTGLETQYRCLCKLPSPHPSAYLPDINEMFRSIKCKSLLLIQIKSSLPGLREEMTDSVRPWQPNIENSIGKWSVNTNPWKLSKYTKTLKGNQIQISNTWKCLGWSVIIQKPIARY